MQLKSNNKGIGRGSNNNNSSNDINSNISNNNNQNMVRLFDHCIIDEAGQCTETDILIPLIYDIDSVVLVGDPQQLPATVFSNGPTAWLYERSLFERLMCCKYPVYLLNTQYRMHPEIAYFPNQHFYEKKLSNGNNVMSKEYEKPFHFATKNSDNLNAISVGLNQNETHKTNQTNDEYSDFLPYLFWNLTSTQSRGGAGHSYYNQNEIDFIVMHLERSYTVCTFFCFQKSSVLLLTKN